MAPILEDKEDEGVVDLLIVNKNDGSILAPCGACGKSIIGAYRCPGYSVYMHVFRGDDVGDEVSVQIRRCPGCVHKTD